MGFVIHPFTEQKKARWEAEGRGTGHGAEYKPWLIEGDVPADSGTLDRFICSLCGRMAITFSSVEQRGRQYYEIATGTKEIRERVPLDRDETRLIAKELGLSHPKDQESDTDYVMTTDLVITRQTSDGTQILLPRSCLDHRNISHWQIIEHSEIERRYWARRKARWKFLTNDLRCMPTQLFENLDKLRGNRFPPENQHFKGQFESLCHSLVEAVLREASPMPLGHWGENYRVANGLNDGEANAALLYLIFHKRLIADIVGSPVLQQRVVDVGRATARHYQKVA
jgi:hypothetical protein